jgi:TonB family protein
MGVMSQKKFTEKQIKWGVALSVLVFHFAILATSVDVLSVKTALESDEKVIKLKLKKMQQIVQTHNKEKTDQFVESKYLSQNNSMVDRQTKARVVDRYQEATAGNRGKDNDEFKGEEAKVKSLKDLKFSDLAFQKTEKLAVEKFRKKSKRGVLTKKQNTRNPSNNDFLDDVDLGDFTQLNTQEYEFYGFYHRIRNKLEQFWGRNLRNSAEKFFRAGRRLPASQNLVTSVQITINKLGEIVNVKINSTSGIRELDDAAVQSFNEAGPFPNPPSKMLKNGEATISWNFVVSS